MVEHHRVDVVLDIPPESERIEPADPKNEKNEETRAVGVVPLEESAEPEANEPEPRRGDKYQRSSQIAWLAIAAFILSVACICGSVFVIVHSDGRRTSQWIPYTPAVQPAVLLAIFSGTFNAAQTIALSEGIVISWWTCASHGTSLSSLHYIWNKGEWKSPSGLMKALSEPRVIHIFLAALASMASSIASGPLLQRSSDTIVGEVVTDPEWDWNLATTVPDGLTGIVDRTAPANLTASDDLQWAVQSWYANRTIIDNGYPPCHGVCYADVILPGVSVSCRDEEKVIDLSAPEQSEAILFDVRYARFDDRDATPVLTIQTLFAKEDTPACKARIHIDKCNYTAAIVQYKLIFDGRIIRLNLTQSPRVVAAMPSPGDSASATDGAGAGPLAGLGWMAQYYFLSNGTINRQPADNNYFWENQGITANQYIDVESDYNCVPRWRSPTNDIIQSIHEVMFRLTWYSTAVNGKLE